MAPRHDYDLRVAASTLTYEVADNIKPVAISSESDELIVPQEEGNVTLDKLKDFVFADEEDDEDPEYVESSGESEDSLEYEFENEAPIREYNLRPRGSTPSCDGLKDLKQVTVKFEWDQLIAPHEEGEITLEKLNEFAFEDEEDDEDPEYEESCLESDDSLEYESEEYESGDNSSLDELRSQDSLESVVIKSCSDFLKSNNVSWSSTNKAEEYIASFGAGQLGIRIVDSGLSVVETPISYYSSWMSDSVRNTRRHLRAARRAGEKINNSCKSRSLLVHMANLFPLNAVFDSLGVSLVNKQKICVVDEDIGDDPEYVLSSDETGTDTDDSLEFRSEIDSDEDLTSDVSSETAESSDGEDEIEENSDDEEDDVE